MAQQSSARTWTPRTPDIGVWLGASGEHSATWKIGLGAPGLLFGSALVVGAAGPLVPSGMCAHSRQEASLQQPRWSLPRSCRVPSHFSALLPSSRFATGLPCPAESRAGVLLRRGCCLLAGMAGCVGGEYGVSEVASWGLWTDVCTRI